MAPRLDMRAFWLPRLIVLCAAALLLGCAKTAQSEAQPAGQSGVRYLGRVYQSAGGAELQWSGSGFETILDGGRLAVTLEDSGEAFFTIDVDGQSRSFKASQGQAEYILYAGAPSRHLIRLTRRSSALTAPTRIVRLDTEGALWAPEAPARRMLVIGDSISTGYGVDGDGPECSFSFATQNQGATYAALAARRFSADLHVVALDGRGLVRNWDDNPEPAMRALERLTIPAHGEIWRATAYQPQVIVVNLGANDFADHNPQPEFTQSYRALLHDLRRDYPNAHIYATTGPMLHGAEGDAAMSAIRQATESMHDPKISFLRFTPATGARAWGCDWHPGARTHQAMARTLESTIRRDLRW